MLRTINPTDLGTKIKVARINARMDQETLAKKAKISTSLISHYESGVYTPKLKTMFYFSQIFNISMDEFLGVKDFPVKQVKIQTKRRRGREALKNAKSLDRIFK